MHALSLPETTLSRLVGKTSTHVQGAAARAVQIAAPGAANKRGALPALAKAPPVTSSTPAPVATGKVMPAKPCDAANVAYAGTALHAGNTAARQKRPATPNSHMQAPAKAACTSEQPASIPKAEQMSYSRRTSHAGEQGSSDVRDNEVMTALRASFQQNPEGVARLLLQSLDKQFPGAMKEAAQGHTNITAQLQQVPLQSRTDVAAMRRAVLHQLLQVNPGVVCQLAPSAAAAVESSAPGKVATPAPAPPPPVAQAQPAPAQSPNDFTAILVELQQCGASDQTIMHVLQTLMQQQHPTAPAAQQQQHPAVPHGAPQLASIPHALGSLAAPADASLLAADPNLLLAALCHQPAFATAQGAVPRSQPWQNDPRAAAVVAHMQPSQQHQYHHGTVQLQVPAVSVAPGSQGIVPSLPLFGEVLRNQNIAPHAVGGGNSVVTQSQLAQILSGLESFNRAHAARAQQELPQQPVSGSR